MSPLSRITVGAAALGLLLAACGGDDEAEPTEGLFEEAPDEDDADEGDAEDDEAPDPEDADDADGTSDEAVEEQAVPDGPPTVNGTSLSADAVPATVEELFADDADGRICELLGIDEEDLVARVEGPPQGGDLPELGEFHSDSSVGCHAAAYVTFEHEGREVGNTVIPALSLRAWRYDLTPDGVVITDEGVDTLESPAGHTYLTGADAFDPQSPIGDKVHVRALTHEPAVGIQVAAHESLTISGDAAALAAILDDALAALADHEAG